MIEFQAAPKPDATDLRVMLEEERHARQSEILRGREAENQRRILEEEARDAQQTFEGYVKSNRSAKVGLHVVSALFVAAVPLYFLVDDSSLHGILGYMAFASIPLVGGLIVGWSTDNTGALKKRAITASEKLANFDTAQKEVAE